MASNTGGLILVEGLIVMAADILAFLLLLHVYRKSRRKSALFFSFAWFFDFLFLLFSSAGSETTDMVAFLMLSIFSMFLFTGSLKLLEEEHIETDLKAMRIIGIAPMVFVLYLYGAYLYTSDARWTALVVAPFGVIGIFVTMAGVLLRNVVSIYHSAAKFLYGGMILFGLHLIPAALWGMDEWYAPVGFTLSATLIIVMLFAILRIMNSTEFSGVEELQVVPGDSSVIVSKPGEFNGIKEKFKDVPVLAFMRSVEGVPPKWMVYLVTNAPVQVEKVKTIHPTELPKMGELIYRYLVEMKQKGSTGVVLIDCLEYLLLYNSKEGLLKFLAQMKDFTVIHGGKLILVIDPASVEENFLSTLHRVLA